MHEFDALRWHCLLMTRSLAARLKEVDAAIAGRQFAVARARLQQDVADLSRLVTHLENLK